MSFTARNSVSVWGLAFLPMMLGGFVAAIVPTWGLAYDALLLGLAAYDYFGTIPRRGIQVERSCPRVLSLGVRQEVTLRMPQPSKPRCDVREDSPPITFKNSGVPSRLKLLPMTVAEHATKVRPTFRGRVHFWGRILSCERGAGVDAGRSFGCLRQRK